MKGLFVSQASQKVGFGHLMECLAIAENLSSSVNFSFLLIGSDPEAFRLLQNKGFAIHKESLEANKDDFDWIFLNTRKNNYDLQEKLHNQTKRLVVLDELGGIKIKCHALINFSINEEWHNYEFIGSRPDFYLGASFFPLRNGLKKVSIHRAKKNSVLVTLGGADRSETVLRVAQILTQLPDISVDYVLGPGCRVEAEKLQQIIKENRNQRIKIAPDNFDELLAEAEFVVSAGGNTLYEAAYFGNKAIVIWEDEHEKVQGESFEKAGLARVAGGPTYIDEELLSMVLNDEMGYSDDLKVDGKGVDRICKILLGN